MDCPREQHYTLMRLLDVGPLAPPARGAHACSSIDNRRMLIHGGIGLSGTRLGDTWVLYLSENLCLAHGMKP
ncbi:hypothetical protein HanIR_Chr09g0450751 [Helianthus annuus]|nr:hypothetical protein HanIR_Chr09g0450751 [Helianthus annuus]